MKSKLNLATSFCIGYIVIISMCIMCVFYKSDSFPNQWVSGQEDASGQFGKISRRNAMTPHRVTFYSNTGHTPNTPFAPKIGWEWPHPKFVNGLLNKEKVLLVSIPVLTVLFLFGYLNWWYRKRRIPSLKQSFLEINSSINGARILNIEMGETLELDAKRNALFPRPWRPHFAWCNQNACLFKSIEKQPVLFYIEVSMRINSFENLPIEF